HCTILENGIAKRIPYRENDHCCERFVLLDAWLGNLGLQREGTVGSAHARWMRSRDVVTVTCQHLAQDPLLFLHPASAMCEDCDAARGDRDNLCVSRFPGQ
ncbi:MAG: hypothetical protein KIT83_13660, partial [Bryobacterales bacterium]|nr:hypothetical protein [Bryobacterales bacterium]